MNDILEKLAADISDSTIKACAKVPAILKIRAPENEYQRGYNAACADIAARIKRLGEPREPLNDGTSYGS